MTDSHKGQPGASAPELFRRGELAREMKVGASLVSAMKHAGYHFTHGHQTTLESALAWRAAFPDFRVRLYIGRGWQKLPRLILEDEATSADVARPTPQNKANAETVDAKRKLAEGVLVTLKELALALSMEESVVSGWKAQGLPMFAGKVFPEDFTMWRREQIAKEGAVRPRQPSPISRKHTRRGC